MASTYTSKYIIPGRRAGPIKQIINDVNSGKIASDDNQKKACYCPSPINSKIVKNSNPDVIPGSTQVERAVNAIKYGRGGKVVFGNAAYQGDGDTLLGRLQGQPLPKFLSMNRF
jgi:hypothetical protein